MRCKCDICGCRISHDEVRCPTCEHDMRHPIIDLPDDDCLEKIPIRDQECAFCHAPIPEDDILCSECKFQDAIFQVDSYPNDDRAWSTYKSLLREQ